ncbi:MAG: TlpA disulfide reductase family protein [Bryobacterales bacterium]|nr:TlpA disulfide reductase family protein [Bryobacterales bacterium]
MASVKTERLLQAIIAVCLVGLGYVIADALREKVVGVGDTAPDFSIVTDSGRRISRSDFGGKLLVLNFWATWCPPCVEEMPSLEEFHRRLAPSGVVVLGISVDQNERAYRAFLERARVTFATARDPEARISAEYGTFKYPETYIIDRSGKVVIKHIGPRDWTDEQIIRNVRALL